MRALLFAAGKESERGGAPGLSARAGGLRRGLWGALLLAALGCPKPQVGPASSPAPAAWRGATAVVPGALPCGAIGGAAADPEGAYVAVAPSRKACALKLIDPAGGAPREVALAAGEGCSALGLGEVGDATSAPAGAGAPESLYLIGTMSVRRSFDASGAAVFDPQGASQLVRVSAASIRRGALGAVESRDLSEGLRSRLLDTLKSIRPAVQRDGLEIELDRRGLVVGGLAAAPDGAFLIGLAAPRACPPDSPESPACRAILFSVDDLGGLFDSPVKEPQVQSHRLVDLGGGGFGSLEYDPVEDGFWAISERPGAKEVAVSILRYRASLLELSVSPFRAFPLEEGRLRAVVPGPGGGVMLSSTDAPGCAAGEGGRLSPLPLSEVPPLEDE